MEVVQKPKIEALYPLTIHQQGLLFHHLSDAEDVGALMVQCELNGKLDFERLKLAWQKTANRHEILRSSVHWKKIETPVILVRPEIEIQVILNDWSSFAASEQEEKLNLFKSDSKKTKITLDKNPLSKIVIVKLGVDSYYLLWYCHHLLLDGWSSNIILNDFMKYYDMLLSGEEVRLETVPSYKSYLSWIKQSSDTEATNFWNKTLEGFNSPTLFHQLGQFGSKKLGLRNSTFSEQTSESLIALAKNNHITMNTLFQGIWSVLLSQYFDAEDVVFGTTVSGRSSGFPKIELMTGMLTNVIPVRANLLSQQDVFESFKNIQSQQQIARNHERFSIEELLENDENLNRGTLFDSLFVFENFPSSDHVGSSLKMSGFTSGVSSTYPLTLIISTKNNITIDLLFDENIISKNVSNWFIEQFGVLVEKLLTDVNLKNIDLRGALGSSVKSTGTTYIKGSLQTSKIEFVAPSTDMEVVLSKIWEQVLGVQNIGINDNFFAIGGKSLNAVKIFSKLSKEHEFKLPPTTLLEYPTIAEIAKLAAIENDDSDELKFLVPLRKKGSKAPLFCVHAGGGHVFFYNDLAKHLSQDRPVYALQPSGIDGANKMHHSISEMTTDYLQEIKRIQPKGPYHILTYCFGTAVGIEIIRQLEKTNEMGHIIIMDTMALQEKSTANRLVMRTDNFVKRFSHNPLKSLFVMASDRITRYVKPFWVQLFGSDDDKNLEALKHNLIVIYKKYEWREFEGQIDLLITKKASESLNAEIIKSWRNLTDEVAITRIDGNHRTLFEEPDVHSVGKSVEESMVSYESK